MRSIYTYLDMGILTARNIDLKRNTKGAVRLVFDWLEKRFGTYDFQTMFEYLPGDQSLVIRMILPKKTNFEFLTQWDVNLIVSRINSTPRKSLQAEHLTM